MELSNLTDAELAAELERRKVARAIAMQKARVERVKLILPHRDTLAKLMTHSRSSCVVGRIVNPGFHPDHGCAECNLCALLDLQEGDDVQIDVEVRLCRA